MSPSSSAAAMPSHIRQRGSSNATPIPDASVRPSRTSSRPNSPAGPVHDLSAPPPYYTVFIRLPFARGDFVDPAPTNWTSAKDRQLWKLISKSHSGDLDWEGLSHEFDVELNFLLMQAAWLSERHMERMRRQVTRIGGGGAGEGTTGSGTDSSVGGVKMERTGSRESKLQAGSITGTTRRGSAAYAAIGDVPGSLNTDESQPVQPTVSRTASSATVTQSGVSGSRLQQPRSRGLRGSSGSSRRALPAAAIADFTASSRDHYYEDALEHEGQSNSDSEDEPPSALFRSQGFRRPPPGKKAKPTLADLASEGDDDEGANEDDDDDESSNGGYLPFAAASKPDPAATLRNSPRRQAAQPAAQGTTNPTTTSRPRPRDPIRANTTESSQSSCSSPPPPSAPTMQRQQSQLSSAPSSSDNPLQQHGGRRASYDSSAQAAHPLSSRHRAQLASLSPRSRRDGSEGSPSMGSSFSDLDDTSVTQSALEEALMSNMRAQGGSTMASRMSSLRDALGRGARG